MSRWIEVRVNPFPTFVPKYITMSHGGHYEVKRTDWKREKIWVVPRREES